MVSREVEPAKATGFWILLDSTFQIPYTMAL